MSRKTYYAIFDEKNKEVKTVVDDFRELNMLLTGIYSEHYSYDIVNRRTARSLNRGLTAKLNQKQIALK